MGNLNQLDFVLENRRMVRGPILEIGSRDYGNTNDFRRYFEKEEYVGVDLKPGHGVDVVCDFSDGFDEIREAIGTDQFGTVICLSVLEHCRNPFKVAENMSQFLAEDGVIFISVPFVWNSHSFPDDYWRFTPSSLSVLFPEFEMHNAKSFYSTKIRGEKLPLTADLAGQERYSPTLMTRILKRCKLLRTKYPYVLFPVLVNAILVRKGSQMAERC